MTRARILSGGFLFAFFATGVALAACGGSNNGAPGEDAGADGNAGSSSGGVSSSSGASSGSSSGAGSGSSGGSSSGGSGSGSSGGGDGGLPDFSVFVIGLVTSDTTSSAIPVPLPAPDAYSDNQSLADYPASFF